MSIVFHDNSKEVLASMLKAKQNALEAIGMTAEGYAKKETPVDTGRLRNSMSHAVDGDSAVIGSNTEYAIFVEEGTSKQSAHHMLRKAATGHSEEYKALAKQSFENA